MTEARATEVFLAAFLTLSPRGCCKQKRPRNAKSIQKTRRSKPETRTTGIARILEHVVIGPYDSTDSEPLDSQTLSVVNLSGSRPSSTNTSMCFVIESTVEESVLGNFKDSLIAICKELVDFEMLSSSSIVKSLGEDMLI